MIDYSDPMNGGAPDSGSKTDYDALARRYLELWQDDIAKLARDQNGMATWTTMIQTLAQSAAAWAGAIRPPATDDKSRTAAPGPSPVAAPSRGGGRDLADVIRRLDAMEQRLAALEAVPAPRRRTRKESH